MGKEELLDGANWTDDMDSRFDTLTGPGGVPDDVARSIVLREAGLRVFPNHSVPDLRSSHSEVSDSEIIEATNRVVDGKEDVPQPAPPKPGETDEQIRQRHRDALRARSEPGIDNTPRTLPPEVQAYRDKLRQASNGSTGEAA